MYITDERYEAMITLPFAFPQTDLHRGDSLVLASVKTTPDYFLRLRWLSMHVPRVTAGLGPVTKISTNRGSVFVGLYSGQFERIDRPTGNPLAWLDINGTGVISTFPYNYSDFTSADFYTLLLVNNTSSHDYDVVVNGAVRLYKV